MTQVTNQTTISLMQRTPIELAASKMGTVGRMDLSGGQTAGVERTDSTDRKSKRRSFT